MGQVHEVEQFLPLRAEPEAGVAGGVARGRFHPVTIGLQGDVGVTARALAERVPHGQARVDQRGDVAERWAKR